MKSRLEATVNGSCAQLQGRIIESFIRVVGDLMVSRSLCEPQHRCRIRNTFVYCSDDPAPPSTPSVAPAGAPLENVTVDFVLETELKLNSWPVSKSDQRNVVHSLDQLHHVFDEMVRGGELTWWTRDSQLAPVSLVSELVQFDMDNCSAGQILKYRNSDTPACRKWIRYVTFDDRSHRAFIKFIFRTRFINWSNGAVV